ncbi:hypothetical protein ACFL0T_01190 [Candidatus Omnitrophota bacterium]
MIRKKMKQKRRTNRSKSKKCLHCLPILLLVLGLACPAMAADDPPEKLAEGIEDIVTAPAELPAEYVDEDERDPISETVVGVGEVAAKTVEGALKVATFPIVTEDDKE